MRAKPNPERDQRIMNDLAAGLPLTEVAEKHGMSKGNIIGIVRKLEHKRQLAEQAAADPDDLFSVREHMGLAKRTLLFHLRQVHRISRVEHLAGHKRSQLPAGKDMNRIIDYAETRGVTLQPEDPGHGRPTGYKGFR